MNVATFTLANLDKIALETQRIILIGGLVTMISDAIGLRYPFNRIHAFGGIRPMQLNFCFNRDIIANLGPAEFELLIDNQVVLKFTLPNHEKTNVYNRDNCLYNLEGQSESPTPPDSPQPYENRNANLPDAASHVSGARRIDPPIDFDIVIHALQFKVDFIRGWLTSLWVDLLKFMDVANEQFDRMFQQVYSLRRSSELNIRRCDD